MTWTLSTKNMQEVIILGARNLTNLFTRQPQTPITIHFLSTSLVLLQNYITIYTLRTVAVKIDLDLVSIKE